MQLVGRRTYAVCSVIIALAGCQRFLGISVPGELWVALFGLVAITMRAAVGNASKLMLLAIAPFLLFVFGCSTVTPDNINAGANWAEKYYEQPNVAEVFHIEGTNVTWSVTGATSITMSTPLPTKNVIPQNPGWIAALGDAAKSIAPYFLLGWMFGGGHAGATTSTVNNNYASP